MITDPEHVFANKYVITIRCLVITSTRGRESEGMVDLNHNRACHCEKQGMPPRDCDLSHQRESHHFLYNLKPMQD